MNKNVYVVSYIKTGEKEPVITVFDNKEAAENCFKEFSIFYEHCYLDECSLYSDFQHVQC